MREQDPTKFNFAKQINLKGEIFDFVDVQRGQESAIYKSGDKYLRLGIPWRIGRDISIHKKMEASGFPVAKFIEEGAIGNANYFIEESIGSKSFAQIFKEETETQGQIQETTFDSFINISSQLAEAQLTTATDEKDWQAFQIAVHLDTVCAELPEVEDKLQEVYQKIEKDLIVFPFVLTHGDFGPFNIYPKGIIDLENACIGPAGYDLGGLIEHLNWFPQSKDYEYHQLYQFSPEQRQRFLVAIDAVYAKHGLPKLSDYLADFNFLKGLWFTANMGKTPKLQQFRYKLLKTLLEPPARRN